MARSVIAGTYAGCLQTGWEPLQLAGDGESRSPVRLSGDTRAATVLSASAGFESTAGK